MNLSKQQLEDQLQQTSETVRNALGGAFKEWPENEALAAKITVLVELSVLYAITSGMNHSIFMSGVLSTWEKLNNEWDEYCRHIEQMH